MILQNHFNMKRRSKSMQTKYVGKKRVLYRCNRQLINKGNKLFFLDFVILWYVSAFSDLLFVVISCLILNKYSSSYLIFYL